MDDFLKVVKEIEGVATLIAVAAYAVFKFFERRKEARIAATKRIEEERKQLVKENNHSPQFTINISHEVKHEVRKIRDRHAAMRVFVIQLSNGTVAATGLPLLKITFTHEVVLDYGIQVERISQLFQETQMPEMLSTPMTVVFKTGEFYLKNIEDLSKTDTHQIDYYNWLTAYGVRSTMWLLIRKHGKPAAVLVCQWPQPTDLHGTIIARIKDINRTIEKIYEKIKE